MNFEDGVIGSLRSATTSPSPSPSVRGIDPALAAAMEAVEKDMNADYALDDMSEEMQGVAIRLYNLLTSYMRQRPSKLVRHVRQENGFAAWQTLLKEMQPATHARSLALLTQLSRVQFAEGKNAQ